jgi:hypothetical protein
MKQTFRAFANNHSEISMDSGPVDDCLCGFQGRAQRRQKLNSSMPAGPCRSNGPARVARWSKDPCRAVSVGLTRLTFLTGCTACFAKRQKLRASVSSNSLPFLTLRMPTPCIKQGQNGIRPTETARHSSLMAAVNQDNLLRLVPPYEAGNRLRSGAPGGGCLADGLSEPDRDSRPAARHPPPGAALCRSGSISGHD